MSSLFLLVNGALVASFIGGGVAKLASPTFTAAAIARFGLSGVPLTPAAVALAILETVLGLGLVVAGTRLPAMFAAGLLSVFVVLIARVLRRGERFPCACFGSLSGSISVWTLARTVGLLMCAITSAVIPHSTTLLDRYWGAIAVAPVALMFALAAELRVADIRDLVVRRSSESRAKA